jgi:hypothetical protein
MTTTMREVPVLDGFLSGAAESNYTGTRAKGFPDTRIRELARVAPVACQVAGVTTAACAPVRG